MKYRLLYTSLVIGSSMMMGACSQQAHYTGGADLERSTVEMVRFAHPVIAEANGSADLSKMSIANLENFTSTNTIGYGDVILFDQGADVAAERIEALASWFVKKGANLGETNGIFGTMPAPGSVTVYIERHIVTAPECQRWSETSSSNPNNADAQPIGCTTQSNLAAMVANPRDLVTGERSGNNPDTTRKAVKTYRLKTPGGTKE